MSTPPLTRQQLNTLLSRELDDLRKLTDIYVALTSRLSDAPARTPAAIVTVTSPRRIHAQ